MNLSDIKVTVIIPVYNASMYLEQCIESVRSQTLQEIEIICIDDGSTDNSLDILKHFAAIDPRIKVFSKPNAGYGHTINYGLTRSDGKYISIIESDDFIDSEGLEVLYQNAEEQQVDYVRANYYEYFNGENRFNDSLKAHPYRTPLSVYEMPQLLYQMEVSPCVGIYRRDFLEKEAIRMNETPGASFQDNSWQFQVLLKAKRIFLLSEGYYHYRLDNEFSSVNSVQKVFSITNEKSFMERVIAESNITDFTILCAYAKFIFVIYSWNYKRIASEFQYAFLLEWKRELKKQQDRGILQEKLFTENEWSEITQILEQTASYFMNTSKLYIKQKASALSLNKDIYVAAMLKKMSECKFVVFGTGSVSNQTLKFLKGKDLLGNVLCFCETQPTKTSFYGKEVLPLDSVPYSKDTLLIAAVSEYVQREVLCQVLADGWKNVIHVDEELQNLFKAL